MKNCSLLPACQSGIFTSAFWSILKTNTFLEKAMFFYIFQLPSKKLASCWKLLALLYKLHPTCQEELLETRHLCCKKTFYNTSGLWVIFLAVSPKYFGCVLRITSLTTMGKFWGKKFWKHEFFLHFRTLSGTLSTFCQQKYSGIIKIAFYLFMESILRKKIYWKKKTFARTFQLFVEEVAKNAFHVFMGGISKNTTFPVEKKHFVFQQRTLGLCSSFFRRAGQHWILSAHRSILMKNIFSQKIINLLSETNIGPKFFGAMLPQKLDGGCQNFHLYCINNLKTNKFFLEKNECFFSNFHQKNWSFLKTFGPVVQTAFHMSGGTFSGKTFCCTKNFFDPFWTMSVFSAVSPKIFGGVLWTVLLPSIRTFWGKKTLTTWLFFISGHWVELCQLSVNKITAGFSKLNFTCWWDHAEKKKCIERRKLSPELYNFLSKNFWRCCQICILRVHGVISKNTTFPVEKKLFFSQQKSLGLCSSIFRRVGQHWILRAHSNISMKNLSSQKITILLSFSDVERKFFGPFYRKKISVVIVKISIYVE